MRAPLDALSNLNSRGLTNADLVTIGRISKNADFSLEKLGDLVEKYGSLEKVISELLETLAAKERKSKGLDRKNKWLEESIRTLSTARVDIIREIGEVKGLIETFKGELLSLPEKAADSINALALKAEQTGLEVGKLQGLATIANFISRGEGEFVTIVQASIAVLYRLRSRLSDPWLQMDIERVTRNLEDHLRQLN